MKRKSIMKIAVAAIPCIIAGYFSFVDNQNDELRGLVLDNIEALATNEGDISYDCLGPGSLDCHGHYAKYMIEGGYRLDLE